MSLLRPALLLALFAMTLSGAAAADTKLSPLVIDTQAGPQRFGVELAVTPQEQEKGLMYRRSMAADAGMLFDFVTPRLASFWMRNTFIPLDMLFIAADGHIADIHERAVPQTDDAVESASKVRAVLELNGGTVARLAIKRGDLVHHAIFGNAAP
jgi:uncharacterized protein